jgi:hypothetical protein
MYGESAFEMRPAVFHSELEAAKKAKQVDFEDLEKRAKDYAKVGQGQPGMRGAAEAEGPGGAGRMAACQQPPRALCVPCAAAGIGRGLVSRCRMCRAAGKCCAWCGMAADVLSSMLPRLRVCRCGWKAAARRPSRRRRSSRRPP